MLELLEEKKCTDENENMARRRGKGNNLVFLDWGGGAFFRKRTINRKPVYDREFDDKGRLIDRDLLTVQMIY